MTRHIVTDVVKLNTSKRTGPKKRVASNRITANLEFIRSQSTEKEHRYEVCPIASGAATSPKHIYEIFACSPRELGSDDLTYRL